MYDSFNHMDNSRASTHLQGFSDRVIPSVANKEHGVLLGFIIASYRFVISTGAIPFRLIMRKNLGERAFSLLAFLVSVTFYLTLGLVLIWLGYLAMLGISLDGVWFTTESKWEKYILNLIMLMINPYSIFCLWFIQKGVSHYKRILDLNRSGIYSYSLSLGDSRYFKIRDNMMFWGFKVDDKIIRMIYEPWGILQYCLLIFVGSFLLLKRILFFIPDSSFVTFLDINTAGFLSVALAMSISAICTSLDEFAKTLHKRGAILDLVDGEVDMKVLIEDKDRLLEKRDFVSSPKQESNITDNTSTSFFVAKVK